MNDTTNHSVENDCWGCEAEPGIDGTLGDACRHRVATRTKDPATPRLHPLIDRLDDVYSHLCWHCSSDLSTTLAGLCPACHRRLRD